MAHFTFHSQLAVVKDSVSGALELQDMPAETTSSSRKLAARETFELASADVRWCGAGTLAIAAQPKFSEQIHGG